MIESLSIRNFKALREVNVALKPLTVIVGPNASGKSSILQAIALYLRPSKIPKGEARDLLRSWNSSEGPTITAVVDGVHLPLDISKLPGMPPFTISVERLERLPWDPVLLDLEPRKLAAPSIRKSVSLSLPSDGEGLSSLLGALMVEKQGRFDKIVERLRSVVPSVEDVRLRPVSLDAGVGYEIVFDMLGARDVPAEAASHGTLLTLGVLAALSVHEGPQVVLIDDLEKGLHPKAMSSFLRQLRGLQDSQLQIVATSHSPYLIDCVEAGEVLLTSIDEKGDVVVRPLTDHPEYERWKGMMAPGEFWSSVGEDWITKGNKATA